MSGSDNENELTGASLLPGWYPDQHDPSRLRWWNGREWADQSTQPEATSSVGATHNEYGTGKGDPRGGTSLASPPEPLSRHGNEKRVPLLWALSAVASVLIVGAVLLFLSLDRGDSHHDFQGTIVLSGDIGDVEGSWDSCSGTGGYSDIAPGASATVRDGNGNIVGSLTVTNLDENTLRAFIEADAKYQLGGWGGDFDEAKRLLSDSADLGILCILYVYGEVKDTDFYTYTISHRGDITSSRDELANDGWWVSLGIGN